MNRQAFRLAARNLSRNTRRNLATGSAIGFGFAGLLTILGFLNQIENNLSTFTIYGQRTGHVVVYRKGGLERFEGQPRKYGLTGNDVASLKRIATSMPQVEMEGAQLSGSALVSNGCHSLPFYASGIDPQLDWKLQQHPTNQTWNFELKSLDAGRELWEFKGDQPIIALTGGLARFLKKDQPRDAIAADSAAGSDLIDCQAPDVEAKLASDPTVQLVGYGWAGTLNGLDAQVTTVFHTANAFFDGSAARMPLADMQKLFGTDGASFYSVWLKDPSQTKATVKELEGKARAAGLDVDIYPWFDPRLSPHYHGLSQFAFTLAGFITMIIASIVVLSVFNSASMTVIERSKEVGMMRSIGFTRRWIRVLFAMEMGVLSLSAIVAGGLGGGLAIFIMNRAGIPMSLPGVLPGLHFHLSLTREMLLTSAFAVLVLAVISGYLAVWKVAKSNIANLLSGASH